MQAKGTSWFYYMSCSCLRRGCAYAKRCETLNSRSSCKICGSRINMCFAAQYIQQVRVGHKQKAAKMESTMWTSGTSLGQCSFIQSKALYSSWMVARKEPPLAYKLAKTTVTISIYIYIYLFIVTCQPPGVIKWNMCLPSGEYPNL